MRKTFLLAILLCALPLFAQAQFNSGSTGADGALDLATMNCPTVVCEVQLPESGILNYTTINIPGAPNHRTLRFKRNSRNTPVIILAQGNVNIDGEINLDAVSNVPGPGGFYGGQVGLSGFGPGAGTINALNATWVGPLSLIPNMGGSGGGGTSQCSPGYSGGGGGGAITVASSTSIVLGVGGRIYARGSLATGCGNGGGSGGGVRLIANNLTVSGSIRACNIYNEGAPFCSVVRLESTNLIFNSNSIPAPVISPINATVIPNAQPQLTIASVGGYAVPSYAGSRYDTVDLLLPNQIPDPVNVVVNANNIPVGTQISVGFVSGSSNGTTTPCNLAGTLASSSCTATISNLNRTGVTYLLATAAFAPPASLARYNPKGKDQVVAVRLETILGKPPKYVFLNKRKKEIASAKIAKEFLQYFGM